MRIHWHRRDLRVADNRGLADAPGRPVGLFVFDEAVLDHAAPPRVAFLLDALSSLRAAYRDRGSELFIRRGDPANVLSALADDLGVDVVSWNRDYSGLAADRDDRVADVLDEVGVTPQRFHDAICHPPGTITTNAGDPYSVYSYFWKKWRDREKDDPYPVPALADATDETTLPTLADLGFDEPTAELPKAGTAPARGRLAAFLEDDIYRYEEARDYPATECTSRLSADLKFGTIGIRAVDKQVREAIAAAETDSERESAAEFRSQLAWREFYTHVLAFNPEVVTENYKRYEHDIDWEDDPELLAAWKRGETGYPIVDAGMRQLQAEAYMHNRVRMIVASFLTKDLLIDWRHGYAHFRDRLVDHDTANDNGGWQWAASTGTDAQPYFRIFNPMTQGERYDPDAEYIREYVPELSGVEADVIHSWHELSPTQRANAAPEYPQPVVDHSQRREQALDMFEQARGDD
ncbi:deoxyribodipyrimidine photolyase [Natronomonas pharaonis DSM 2160]|uniref:Deoxyribodipyrimidine photolyase n=1 Tax=Natronomonas pharaonis (strain ATCC 35678 / DSM 2160 / CIP 103997 / JCM 8858 / NBRC 14720 / NCIMB 2260 / Gabara) TaxID=348780 RepID=A0A1U7EY18_NATPD|nr:deoxyribodipyrimidine photo-lyase [Natronomonas pharaonis]CAI50112.1 deoxyribodipyrimidine photolyase [Natronomonas pharaonis DSM 2160]